MNEDKIIGKKLNMRLIVRTQSIEEANEVAEKYEAEGYETEIVKRKRGQMVLYEVWISGEPKGLYAKKEEESLDYL